jgi:hypothetical protein
VNPRPGGRRTRGVTARRDPLVRPGARIGAAVILAGVLATSAPSPAWAQDLPEVDLQVVVFLIDRVSFEELLAVPQIRALARRGGAGLMTTRTVPGDTGNGRYVTLGAGAVSAGPEERVLAYNPTERVFGDRADDRFLEAHPGEESPVGPFLMDPEAYVEANEGRSVPGSLGEVLARKHRTVSVFGNSDYRAGRHRPAVLLAMRANGEARAGRLGFGLAPAFGGEPAFPVPIARPNPDELGGFRTDYSVLRFLAEGAVRPPAPSGITSHLTVLDFGDTARIDTEAPFADPGQVRRQRREALMDMGEAMGVFISRLQAPRAMVVVVSPNPSHEMRGRKDELAPLVVAQGPSDRLFPESGSIRTLTSDTTRRVGVVSNEDVAPTILSFFGIFAPAEMHGSAVRVVDAPLPFPLHERHLANRRMTVPIQIGAGVAITVVGLASIALILGRRRVPRWVGLATPALPLMLGSAAVALLAAGDLQTLGYGNVVGFLVLVTVGTAGVAAASRVAGPLVPPAVVGLVVLAYLAAEAESGWTATLHPFLGGSALDGARFYGMPNVEEGLLLGAAAFVAAAVPTGVGFLLLVYAALFAGLPEIGANLGGALAGLVGAGVYLALRLRGRVGWPRWLMAAGVVVAGMALVLAAHRFAESPTHGSRLLESSTGLLDLLGTAVLRLAVGWRLVLDVPFAAIPVLGLPVLLYLALRPRGVLADAFARFPAARAAIVAIVAGSLVAVAANDSGPAAAGLGFGMALGGILYVSLVEARWRTATG